VPIVVKLKAMHAPTSRCSRLAVPGSRGPVMLGSGDLAIDSGRRRSIAYAPANIKLRDRVNRSAREVEKHALALPSLKNLPAACRRRRRDAEAMGELFADFGLDATGVLCIYIVLVLLFQTSCSGDDPVGAGLSIPGAFLALFITHTALSMPSMIAYHVDGHRDEELESC